MHYSQVKNRLIKMTIKIIIGRVFFFRLASLRLDILSRSFDSSPACNIQPWRQIMFTSDKAAASFAFLAVRDSGYVSTIERSV